MSNLIAIALSYELVINSAEEGLRIALLKDKELVEFHHEKKEDQFTVGDLYLGTVRKVVPGLNAAFVDIGYHRDAFLHYLDLGPKVRSLHKYTKAVMSKKDVPANLNNFKMEPEIDKLGKISQVLTRNQKILVQVAKEPISSKGPRLSCELSIPGRYIVLVPFSNVISVSRKINDAEERKRLKRLIDSIRPENFGVIIRTVARGKEVAELNRDMRTLIDRWAEGRKRLKNAQPREKILGEVDRASGIIRDMMNEDFDSIIIDDKKAHEEIKRYIGEIAPDRENIVKLHTGKTKLFEQRDVERQLKTLFGQSVSLPGGGYLIIEHTEALHVIDVNSGNKSNQETNQETTALNTNIQAVKEIARQLRLRDMGGIIVCDFIDMRNADHRKQIFEQMKHEMKQEKTKSVILPLSKFGLLQITRQRIRPELNISTHEVCPNCNGSGKITASISVVNVIENNIDHLLTKQNEAKVTLAVHPFLYAYFTKGVISKQIKWFMKYKKWVSIMKDSSLGFTSFSLHNSLGEEIEIL